MLEPFISWEFEAVLMLLTVVALFIGIVVSAVWSTIRDWLSGKR